LTAMKHAGPKQGLRQSGVCAVKFVNGGHNILSCGFDHQQLVWDAQTGAGVATLNGHAAWVEAIAISPDGKCVATGGPDALIRLWDATKWQPLQPPDGPRQTIFRLEVSPDGKYVLAGGIDGGHVWEIASGKQVRSLPLPSDDELGNVLFSPDGDIVATDLGGKCVLFPRSGGPAQALAASGRLLDFTPDGKTLLTSEGNALRVWNWPACSERAVISMAGQSQSSVISPDGKTAAVRVKGGTTLIDLPSAKMLGQLPFNLHWFHRVAGFDATGRLICGVTMSSAEAWSIRTKSAVRTFETPFAKDTRPYDFHGFALSADGRRSASCHEDGSVTVYETATGGILAHFHGHRGPVFAIALTPDGNRVLSAGADHQVLVWDVSLKALAGNIGPLSAADRFQAWDQLGSLPAKTALKTMAALAADSEGTVALFAAKLKPAVAVDSAVLDRIWRELADAKYGVREKAERELNELGASAIAGIREREAKSESLEVKQRAQKFLRRFDPEEATPDNIRVLRALDVLAAANTIAARKLVERLAGGASDVWETEAARRTLGGMLAPTQ
jgi:WD40 repeat protein